MRERILLAEHPGMRLSEFTEQSRTTEASLSPLDRRRHRRRIEGQGHVLERGPTHSAMLPV